MMKLYLCIALLAPVSAFVILASRPCRLTTSIQATSDAERHTQETQAKVWSELKKKEKDMIIQETIKGTDQEKITKKLVEEMLTAAIDHVKMMETEEEKHAAQAHAAFEKAVQQEKVLEEYASEAEHDADDADAILSTYRKNDYPEDLEERREMAVADLAHHVDNYVEERLRQAFNDEFGASQEEQEALKTLFDLKLTEAEFTETLAEIKKLDSATN